MSPGRWARHALTTRPSPPARDPAGRESGTGATADRATADRLRVRWLPRRPAAAVLLLHGGRADSLQPVSRLSLPELRMRLFAAEIGYRPWGRDVLLAQVSYRCRGWNGHHADPVVDATRALEALSRLAPQVPVVLIGHSMGGRAALACAGYGTVRGVVALAPWCPPGEPVAHLRSKAAVFLHDEDDTVTSAEQTWAFARRARAAGADVQTVAMPAGGHAMLRGARLWHRLAADHTAAILTWGPRPANADRTARGTR